MHDCLTGSKEFNLRMRSYAKKLGYTLNQKGLMLHGKYLPGFNTEMDIFKYLNYNYKDPKDR